MQELHGPARNSPVEQEKSEISSAKKSRPPAKGRGPENHDAYAMEGMGGFQIYMGDEAEEMSDAGFERY